MLALRRILIPVDFSDKCGGAARYAKTLASRFHSQLTLLHVFCPFHMEYRVVLASAGIADLGARNLARAKQQLDAFLTDELQGLEVARVLVEGDPAPCIVEHSRSEKVDLIVMPTHGYGPFRRFLLGSVVAKVLHDADCPVWTGVHMEEVVAIDSITVQRIACAVDLGPQSESVISWASEMAAAFEARLLVVHVTPRAGAAVADASPPDMEAQNANEARERIRELLSRTSTEADIRIGAGNVSRVVCDVAARQACDVLVIGRGATRGVVRRLGSLGYAIIRESPCPVVSV